MSTSTTAAFFGTRKWNKTTGMRLSLRRRISDFCPPKQMLRKDGQRYAVNYVRERELYIAWNVTSPDAQGQTVFRLLQGALEGAEPNRLLAVEKAAGHRGWGKRDGVCLWPRRGGCVFGCCDGGRNRRPRPMKEFGQENGRFSVLGEASIVNITGLY